MFRYSEKFDMFNGIQVRDLLEGQKRDIKIAIEQISDNEILNIDEVEYVDELLQDHTFECPVINFEGVYVSDTEELISSEQCPLNFVTRPGKSYPAHIIYYHLPFTGDAELFHNTPSQFSLWFSEVYIEDQEVCFEIIDFRKDMEVVKAEAERIINSIKTFSKELTKDVEVYGIQRTEIESLIQARKQRLFNHKNMLASLGVPIRNSANDIKSAATTSKESEKGEKIIPSTQLPDPMIEVFISYSRKDKRYRDKLEIQLALLQKKRLISIWHDHKIGAGEEWANKIDEHLNSAQIILLLVSPDFIASDYCYSREMARAMDRHTSGEAHVIPIILRSVELAGTELAKLQALPTNAKPITTWRNQDEAFLDVVKGIREAVGKLTTNLEITANVTNTPQKTQEQLASEANALGDALKYQETIDNKHPINHIVGNSNKMREVYDLVARVAKSDAASVWISGESGTGKGIVAQAIHEQSSRASMPFRAFNCAAIGDQMIEGELFGYERYAFTEEKKHKLGLIELAEGSTLLLDDIGHLSLDLQVKLLRVMETGRFFRIGGKKGVKSDVRILAATNYNLEKSVKDGSFRSDLFFRLALVHIILPPLRDRSDDILIFALHFIEETNKVSGRSKPHFTAEAEQILLSYDWPGNVRELRAVIQRAILLSGDNEILPAHLPDYLVRKAK